MKDLTALLATKVFTGKLRSYFLQSMRCSRTFVFHYFLNWRMVRDSNTNNLSVDSGLANQYVSRSVNHP